MGEVYRAHHTALRRDVAIKIVPAALASDPVALATLPHRSTGSCGTLAPEHPRHLRYRERCRRAVRGYGAARRPDSARHAADIGCRAATAQSHRLLGAGGRGSRGCARPRHHASRSEAGEHLHHPRRPSEDSRLRPGQGHRPGRERKLRHDLHPDIGGYRAGHRRLHVARAGARPGIGPAIRHLLLRPGALRNAHRVACVRGALSCRDNERNPQRGAARVLAMLQVPPGLDRIVRRCVEKDPETRFQSARDLGLRARCAVGIRFLAGTGPDAGTDPGLAAMDCPRGRARRGSRNRCGRARPTAGPRLRR